MVTLGAGRARPAGTPFDGAREIGHTGVVKSRQGAAPRLEGSRPEGLRPDSQPSVPPDAAHGGGDGRTRDRVVRILLESGPATAAELARRLDLSSAAIRRHLDAMVSDGIITPTTVRARGPRGRGRPARHYALTDAGHEVAGPTAYSELAASALRFLAETCGPAAVARFAETRGRELELRLAHAVGRVPADRRPAALAAAMTEAGYAASVSQVPSGTQICQHHCPVQHVAEEFPELCDAETAALSRLLHTHVQRLATIAHGDGVCTTHVPGKSVTATGTGAPAPVAHTSVPVRITT